MRDPRALADGMSGRAHALGAAGTLVVHGLFVTAFLVSGPSAARRPMPIAYRVNLIAAPAAPAPAAAASAATPTAPSPPAPAAPKPAVRAAAPVPKPAAVRARPTAAPAAPAAATTQPTPAPAAAAPGAAPGVGSDVATVRTEGVEFPFPGYLRNLVTQVYQRWRPPPGNSDLEAEVFFLLHRDGSVTGIQFFRRSGSFAFDLEAQGAIEAAARAGGFGGLPSGYGADVLPVSFFFSPKAVQ